MNKIALSALVVLASATASAPAFADRDIAVKCVAEYTEARWPHRATAPYVPDNTLFRFVCPGLSPRTIAQLYQLDYDMVELPFKEPAPGNATRYVVWMER
jgi:hypothetical protein